VVETTCSVFGLRSASLPHLPLERFNVFALPGNGTEVIGIPKLFAVCDGAQLFVPKWSGAISVDSPMKRFTARQVRVHPPRLRGKGGASGGLEGDEVLIRHPMGSGTMRASGPRT